jgi:hypothetical protein
MMAHAFFLPTAFWKKITALCCNKPAIICCPGYLQLCFEIAIFMCMLRQLLFTCYQALLRFERANEWTTY